MTTPGASIILDTDNRIASGVYADIFRPSEGALVYKLCIGFRHHTPVSQGLTDPSDDHRRRKTVDSECRAHEIAGQANTDCTSKRFWDTSTGTSFDGSRNGESHTVGRVPL